MTFKPNHSCFSNMDCAACAFELGELLAKKKQKESAKYLWMVVDSDNPCDIRRYAFSHQEAITQLAHAKKSKYKDKLTSGTWTLFKLVKVNKNKL